MYTSAKISSVDVICYFGNKDFEIIIIIIIIIEFICKNAYNINTYAYSKALSAYISVQTQYNIKIQLSLRIKHATQLKISTCK